MNLPRCRKLQVETSNVCNYKCKICPRLKLKVPLKHMSLDTFKKIVSNSQNVKQYDLTGWGEPLSNPHLPEFIKILKEKDKKVSFTTNASLLKTDLVKMLNRKKVDEIAISIDDVDNNKDGHPIDKITSQLSAITKTKRAFRLRIQTTFIGQSLSELSQIAKMAISVGAEEWRIIRYDQRYQEKKIVIDNEAETFRALYKKFHRQIRVSMAQYRIYNDWRDLIYGTYQLLQPQHCPKLIEAAYANVDGFLTPCCALPKLEIGDLKTTPLNVLWKSKEFSIFRKNHRKICQSCQVLTR